MTKARVRLRGARAARRASSIACCVAFATMLKSITTGASTQAVANDALNRMEVDTYGLDEMDRKLLLTIIEKFNGGQSGSERFPLRFMKKRIRSRRSLNRI